MKPPLQPCGTDAAWQRHQINGETPCEPCQEAHRVAQRSYQGRYKLRRRVPARRAADRLIANHADEYATYLAEEQARGTR